MLTTVMESVATL